MCAPAAGIGPPSKRDGSYLSARGARDARQCTHASGRTETGTDRTARGSRPPRKSCRRPRNRGRIATLRHRPRKVTNDDETMGCIAVHTQCRRAARDRIRRNRAPRKSVFPDHPQRAYQRKRRSEGPRMPTNCGSRDTPWRRFRAPPISPRAGLDRGNAWSSSPSFSQKEAESNHFRTQALTRFGAQREEIHQPSAAGAPTPV